MARTIAIGAQGFEELRTRGCFYVDKTGFIRDWWLGADSVTLICRPRGFGKTLNLDTVRCFLSKEYAGRGEELFGGLDVLEGGTEDENARMRALQGTVPVVALSFAGVKEEGYPEMLEHMGEIMVRAKKAHPYLLDWEGLDEDDRDALARIEVGMSKVTCASAPNTLCHVLARYWGTRPVVLLDGYDAPMETAWACGFWREASSLMGDLMVSTFKANPALSRGLVTGVTRAGGEPVFGYFNNAVVATASTGGYATSFGFTQAEVDAAFAEYGLEDRRDRVRLWYGGFTFGGQGDMYNPWSITSFLEEGGRLRKYWANTSAGGLVSMTLREGDAGVKEGLEALMRGEEISVVIDEQADVSDLPSGRAVWPLLLSAGYVTSPGPVPDEPEDVPRPLRLTNREVRLNLDRMVERWFGPARASLIGLGTAILAGDAEGATECLSDIALSCMPTFDGGRRPSEARGPESFYHGLVLGLLVSLRGTHVVRSNPESGFGRLDVTLVPKGLAGDACVMELKVFDPEVEQTLEDTVERAKAQIDQRAYVKGIVSRGLARERVHTLGVAFRGKEVLVG